MTGPASIPEPDDIDPVGLWYRARLRDGIDDRIWFGFFADDPAATSSADQPATPQWHTMSHCHYDGIGGLAELLAAQGWQVGALPTGRDRQAPSLLDSWRQRRAGKLPATDPARPRWRALDPARSHEAASQPPVACLLDAAATAAIDQAARAAGVSTTSWLLWTADRAARELIAEADAALPWVFPVNLRGAVPAPRASMNQCSGIAVQLAAGTTAAALHAQISARLAAGEHWRIWRGLQLGRWLGAAGVRLLYRLLRAPAGRHAGSYTNLGDWPPPNLASGGQPEPAGVVAVAPGSPAYPIAAGTLCWRGRRAFGCRLHPVLDRPGLAAAFVARWRALAAG